MPDDAERSFTAGKERYLSQEYDGAIRYFQKSVQHPAYTTESYFYIGLCFSGMGRYDLARAQYRSALHSIRGPDHPLARKLKRQLYLLPGGRGDSELRGLDRPSEDDVEDPFVRGQELYITEQYEDAIALFERAARDGERRCESLYFMGLCYRELGSYGVAVRKLRQALKLAADPESELARKIRGELRQLETDGWA